MHTRISIYSNYLLKLLAIGAGSVRKLIWIPYLVKWVSYELSYITCPNYKQFRQVIVVDPYPGHTRIWEHF